MAAGRQPLLVVGASTRAAAASAVRAGFAPFCLDLFADRDLRAVAAVRRCPADRYPHGFIALAQEAPPGPWLYTGGLENHPDVVAAVSADRELWGNGPDVLATVRDPAAVSDILGGEGGLAHPRFSLPGSVPPPGVAWLRKARRSAGGFGIRLATPDDIAAHSSAGGDYYLQECVAGDPMSAVFRTAADGTDTLGVSRQLVGTDWLHAPPFRYAGNVGPVRLSPSARRELTGQAFRLVRRTGLRSVWGFDFILAGDRPYLIEVNPRYTASVELFEYAHRISSLGGLSRRRLSPPPETTGSVMGKAIYYAPHRITVPAAGPWADSLRHAADVWRRPDFADVPEPGEVIGHGQPVLTLLAEGHTEADCLARLKSRAAELDQLFGFTSPVGEQP